jgi:hypothetical protein
MDDRKVHVLIASAHHMFRTGKISWLHRSSDGAGTVKLLLPVKLLFRVTLI